MSTPELPYVSNEPGVGGGFRTVPEDFVVEEIAAYEPSGEGEHLYVTFEKRGHTTPHAVSLIARAIGADPRAAGWAGLKDRNAVTTQTVSFTARGVAESDVAALALDGIRVIKAVRHANKLRPGHTRGNRFVIRIRDVEAHAAERAERIATALRLRGIANFFGDQRFGREGDNASRALAWLRDGSRPPRDGFARKMLVSALQSSLFNAYVARRLSEGRLGEFIAGDLAVRHPFDRPFAIERLEAERTYPLLECSPTGPMFGPEMRAPDAEAGELEASVLAASGIARDTFERAGKLARGTRRAARIPVHDLRHRIEESEERTHLVLEFTLPAGAYATTVVREFRPAGAVPNAGIESEESEV